MNETFNERFERLLKEKNLQKKDVAENCGISPNGISTWKITGTIPRADIAIKIADYLGVTTEYLITGNMTELKGSALALKVATLPPQKQKIVQAVLDALDLF